MVSSFHPTTSSDATPEDDQLFEDRSTRRANGGGRTIIRDINGSGRKKKTLIEELGGQQVTATQQSTSYGSGTAVRPIQIKRTIEGQDLTTQMRHIIGSSKVPHNPNQRVGNESAALHARSSKAPSINTATAPAPSYATPKSKVTPVRKQAAVRESPAFDEASEAVDRATFTPMTLPKTLPKTLSKTIPKETPAPRKRTPIAQPALSEVPEEEAAPPPEVQAPVPAPAPAPVRKPMPHPATMLPPAKPASTVKKPTPTRPRSQTLPSGPSVASRLLSWSEATKKFFTRLWLTIKEYIRTILTWLGLTLLLLLIVFGTDNPVSRNAGYHYHTTVNNIRHYTPDAIAHPLYWFNHQSIRSLNERVTFLEIDVDQLKLDVERDHQAIERVSEQLPDFVVAKKNKEGEVELPIDFWHAIRGKITLDKGFKDFGKKSAQKPAVVDWNDFWNSNEQRVKKIAADEVKVSRAEIEQIIQHDIDGANKHSAEDVAKLRKRIESHYAHKSELLTLAEVKKYVDEGTRRQLSSSKIEAVISNKIREQSKQRFRAYNHFAQKMGAVPISQHTSPTYIPDHYEGVSPGGWVVGKVMGFVTNTKPPQPLKAHVALEPWNDAGDCWCAVTKDFGAQLQVRTREKFYPTEVIIEHVNMEATLDKGSAPKDMELFVKIPIKAQDDVSKASEHMFSDAAPETVLDHTWVRIARWTYDFMAGEDVQVFGVQLDLARWGITVGEFVVRAKSNWGGETDHTCFYRVRVHGNMPEEKKEV